MEVAGKTDFRAGEGTAGKLWARGVDWRKQIGNPITGTRDIVVQGATIV